MDRPLVYAGQVPRALDNLNLGEFAMVGLAKLSEALLGTSTIVAQGSFAVTPATGLNVSIAAGQVYQLASIEPTTQSALNVNGHQILKQGVTLDAQTQTLTPPGTVGYSQAFLVQVAYQDVNDGQVVLSYQNPTPVLDTTTNTYKYVTYPGPGGNGAANYTILRGGVSVIIKPGTAATSGTQTAPAPDAGYVGLYVITLAYGATSISTANITTYANAPFLPVTLPGVPAGVQAGLWTYGTDTGTADNYAVTLSPNSGAPVAGQRVFIKFSAANATTSPVLNFNSTGNKSLLRRDGSAPAVGDIPAGWRWVFFDGAAWRIEGAVASDTGSTAAIYLGANGGGQSYTTPGTYTFTVPANVYKIFCRVWGGGGGGGGTNTAGGVAAGGGAGGYAEGSYAVTPGQQYTVTVGARGTAGAITPTNGGGGGTSSVGSLISATGGGGGGAFAGSGINTTSAAGGVGSGGQFNAQSGGGGVGFNLTGPGIAAGGIGGGAQFGGFPSPQAINAAGQGGYSPGGGGQGGVNGTAGGLGGAGEVNITY